jgi:hypothetical protein
MTGAQMRKLALAMPEAEERSHFGQPDFRVRGKIFAGVSPKGDQATLKLTPELQAMALDGNPRAFFPAAGAWGRKGWTHVRLPHADAGEVGALVAEAWRLTAPRRLVSAFDAAPPGNRKR